MTSAPAIFHGPTEPALWHKTLGELIDLQEAHYGSREAVVVPWQSARLSYRQLAERSRVLAQAMLNMGLHPGDCVGIMAGNCYQYIEVFLGSGRIGCPVVVLNNTYTPAELTSAVHQSSCKLVFITASISKRTLSDHIQALRGEESPNPNLPELRRIVLIGDGISSQTGVIQLTDIKGTTGSPKAAMLTHTNLLNNARFVGQGLALSPQDKVLSPPPLFHCFGLVLGFLSSFIHGSTIILPSPSLSATSCVDALLTEHATVILGVPTMYLALLDILAQTGTQPLSLRAALASGSPVSPTLMARLRTEMGIPNVLIAYGMTETSPVTFMTRLSDDAEKGITTVGRVLPHTWAKVVDREGAVVARGVRGELCTAGFAVQRGYWRNVQKTAEVMRRDEAGVLWMLTGDEVVMDAEGFVAVTGRIKNLIIRGGENIFPREIEDRLTAHPAISEASVVGIQNERYGEVVGAFLKAREKVSHDELRHWVSQTLGRHKAPQHIFWIGDAGVGADFPKTGSGKHQKHLLRELGNRLVRERERNRARL
ncbi:hypothetical protein ASPACDRAFT_1883935 [Aspergillus aculeatus ATCC 16872]|uniref:AMP-dependent synthetase/ligase domain-containing protein n=1 Tax=Aspergillus aculeatus (strain ATCC 16872 / CBS 172.66 / WB 5094) TaxID=690307 RepID=A0A1L9WEU4_ASPA1|nr:uncharacterized protein ASPACDRAFT_1883935 [Aspergillus aculeatus ATCC 16872]OJJ94673.1 hypothetical protein ASPACDRAFT_1883935 [Aspergillus aculeatus ATCC 16872]